jgi:hypothetical protein
MRSITNAQRGSLLPRCILHPRLPHAGRTLPPLPTSHCLPTTSFLPTSPSLPRHPSRSAATGTALRPACSRIYAEPGPGSAQRRGQPRRAILGVAVQPHKRAAAAVASRHGAVWARYAAWALWCSRTSTRQRWSPPGTVRCRRHTPVAADTPQRSRTSRPRRWPPPAIASLRSATHLRPALGMAGLTPTAML